MEVNGSLMSGLIFAPLIAEKLAVAYGIYNVYFHPLAKFPGPRLWALTRLTFCYSLQKGDLQTRIKDFHEQYGSVVRIAPDELSFIDATAWRDIYSGQVGNNGFPKNPVVSGSQGFPSIIDANDSDHHRIRKLLARSFSVPALREKEHVFQSYISLLIKSLKECPNELSDQSARRDSKGEAIVNIVKWINFTTFDITGEMTFSESIGCLKDRRFHPWIMVIFSHLKLAALQMGLLFYTSSDKAFDWILPQKLLLLKKNFIQFSLDKIHRRMDRQDAEKLDDYMSSAMRHSDGRGMSTKELEGTFSTLLVAGSETMSSWLAGTINYLSKNPPVFRRLATEIRSFTNEGDITINSVTQLPYLTAVLNEGLRMCPPVPCGLTRIVPPGGAWVSDRWVPGGTFVATTHYAAYMSKSNFSRPDEFIPERWLNDESREPVASVNRQVFQPFSAGARNCLGYNIAWAEGRLMVARLVWNFDLTPLSELDWAQQKTYMMWQKEPFYVQLTPVGR
ncbi:MAG: hypothetical protein Q9167_004830 [Letrouitia subvulpina]